MKEKVVKVRIEFTSFGEVKICCDNCCFGDTVSDIRGVERPYGVVCDLCGETIKTSNKGD